MKCSMTGFVISENFEFAGGKGTKVFFEEAFEADGKELKQRVPLKIWHSTHQQDLPAFKKGTRMTVSGYMQFRRYRKGGNDGPWTDDVGMVMQDFEVLPYERTTGGGNNGGF